MLLLLLTTLASLQGAAPAAAPPAGRSPRPPRAAAAPATLAVSAFEEGPGVTLLKGTLGGMLRHAVSERLQSAPGVELVASEGAGAEARVAPRYLASGEIETASLDTAGTAEQPRHSVALSAHFQVVEAVTGRIVYQARALVTRYPTAFKTATPAEMASRAVDQAATDLIRGLPALAPAQIEELGPEGLVVSTGVRKGQYLRVFRLREPVRDPATGVTLPPARDVVAHLRVTEVLPDGRARAVVLEPDGTERVKVGDLVEAIVVSGRR